MWFVACGLGGGEVQDGGDGLVDAGTGWKVGDCRTGMGGVERGPHVVGVPPDKTGEGGREKGLAAKEKMKFAENGRRKGGGEWGLCLFFSVVS